MNFFPVEKTYYETLFQQADSDKDGKIGGKDALFLRKSDLNETVLGMIWGAFNTPQLSKDQFFIMMRMIGLAQKRNPSFNNFGFLSQMKQGDINLPQFKDIPLPNQTPTPAASSSTTNNYGSTSAPTASNTTTTPSTGPISLWEVPEQVKPTYQKFFEICDANKAGEVTGVQVKQLFAKSGLSESEQSQVFNLVDTLSRRKLNLAQFTVAMHLLSLRKNQRVPSVPQQLPDPLAEYIQRNTSAVPNISTPPSSGPTTGPSKLESLAAPPSSSGANRRRSNSRNPIGPDSGPPTPTGVSPMTPPHHLGGSTPSASPLSTQTTPSTAAPNTSTAAPNTSTANTAQARPLDYSISPPDRAKYIEHFKKAVGITSSTLNATRGRELFLKSTLPPQVVAQIWRLCDYNNTGHLNQEQFVMAMHLIHSKLKYQVDLPNELPSSVRLNLNMGPTPQNSFSDLKEKRGNYNIDLSTFNTNPESQPASTRSLVSPNIQQNLQKDELSMLEHSIEEQQRKKSQLVSELSVVKQPNVEIESQITEAENQLKDINNDILNIENQIIHEKNRKSTLEQIRNKTQMSVGEAEKKRNQMNQEIEQFREELRQEEEQSKEFTEKASETQQELMEQREKVDEIKRQVDQLREENIQKKKEVDSNRQKLTEVQSNLEQLGKEKTAAEEELETLMKRLKKQKQEELELQSRQEMLTKEIEEKKRRNVQVQSEISQLEKRNKELSEQNTKLQQESSTIVQAQVPKELSMPLPEPKAEPPPPEPVLAASQEKEEPALPPPIADVQAPSRPAPQGPPKKPAPMPPLNKLADEPKKEDVGSISQQPAPETINSKSSADTHEPFEDPFNFSAELKPNTFVDSQKDDFGNPALSNFTATFDFSSPFAPDDTFTPAETENTFSPDDNVFGTSDPFGPDNFGADFSFGGDSFGENN